MSANESNSMKGDVISWCGQKLDITLYSNGCSQQQDNIMAETDS
jgi:hypothetical protein